MARVIPDYKEEARTRILKAAEGAFSEKGYDQTTMEEIAQRLGVSKGTLYLYFPSKEALFARLTEMRQDVLRQVLQASLKNGDLLQTSRAFFDAVSDAPDVYSMKLTFEVISEAVRNETLKRILLDDYHKRLDILEGFLEEQITLGLVRNDINVRQLALALSSLFNGLMIARIVGLERELISETWMSTLKIMYSSPLRAVPVRSSSDSANG